MASLEDNVKCHFCSAKQKIAHSFKLVEIKGTGFVVRTCEPCFYKNLGSFYYPTLMNLPDGRGKAPD